MAFAYLCCKEMSETFAVHTAAASFAVYWKSVSNISLALCREFCSTIRLQLLAIVHSQDCIPVFCLFFIFNALIYTTKFLEALLYRPITSILISPCSADIGNCFGSVVPKFEIMQHKQTKAMFFLCSSLRTYML